MNRSRSLAAALSLLLLAGVGACSSDSSGDKGASSSSSSKVTSPAETPKTLTSDSGDKAKQYVDSSFSGSSWLKSVEHVKVDNNKLVAETKLGSSKADKSDASEICRALSAYEVSNEGGFQGVVVKSKDGKTLVERTSLAKPC